MRKAMFIAAAAAVCLALFVIGGWASGGPVTDGSGYDALRGDMDGDGLLTVNVAAVILRIVTESGGTVSDADATPTPMSDTHGGAVIPVTVAPTSVPIAAPANPPEYTVAPEPVIEPTATPVPPVDTPRGGFASSSNAW